MLKYPSWRYHATMPACIVHDPEAEAALGPGWCDSPAVDVPQDVVKADEPDAVEVPIEAHVAPAIDAESYYVLTATAASALVWSLTDLEALKSVQDLELAHPKGPRKSVLKALDTQLALHTHD